MPSLMAPTSRSSDWIELKLHFNVLSNIYQNNQQRLDVQAKKMWDNLVEYKLKLMDGVIAVDCDLM